MLVLWGTYWQFGLITLLIRFLFSMKKIQLLAKRNKSLLVWNLSFFRKYTIFIHKLYTANRLYTRPMHEDKASITLGFLETFFPILIQLKNVHHYLKYKKRNNQKKNYNKPSLDFLLYYYSAIWLCPLAWAQKFDVLCISL